MAPSPHRPPCEDRPTRNRARPPRTYHHPGACGRDPMQGRGVREAALREEIARLRARIDELEDLRDSHEQLDARLRERTRQLERANNALEAQMSERERLESQLLQSQKI